MSHFLIRHEHAEANGKISFIGRTRAEAFEIGEKMAEEVTKLNPKPVKLKFEKGRLNLFEFRGRKNVKILT